MRRLMLIVLDLFDTLLIDILTGISCACMGLISRALLRCDARAIERTLTE